MVAASAPFPIRAVALRGRPLKNRAAVIRRNLHQLEKLEPIHLYGLDRLTPQAWNTGVGSISKCRDSVSDVEIIFLTAARGKQPELAPFS
jgi:hypothetical protein